MKSATDGYLMYSVNKRDNGKIPANIIFSAAVSVMSREEAKILMTIKANNNLTEEDLFENIERAFQIMNDDNENENEKKIGNQIESEERNFSVNSFKILEERNEQMIMHMKKKNNVGGMKYRALSYLQSSLLKQKENLKSSFNSIAIFNIDEMSCIGIRENSDENENGRNINLNHSFQINSNKNSNTQMQRKSISNTRNTIGTGTLKSMNAMSKNNKSHLILSCKWLLQVTPPLSVNFLLTIIFTLAFVEHFYSTSYWKSIFGR